MKNRTIEIVSYVVLALFALLLIAVLFKWMFAKDVDSTLLVQVAQATISLASGAVGYWLGSSNGSRNKEAALIEKGIKNETN